MNRKQLFYLLVAFLCGLVLSQLVGAQEITGATVAPVNRQSVYEITGVETADWGVVSPADGCDYNVDSQTLKIFVTPYKKGTVWLNAAVTVEGKPKLVTYSFDVIDADRDDDQDDKQDDDKDDRPPILTLEQWVEANKPKSLTSNQMATMAAIFRSASNNIDRGLYATDQQLFNSIRVSMTSYFAKSPDAKTFLDGVSERMDGQPLKELSASCKTVADVLQSQNADRKIQNERRGVR
jgi:hypothetical protein